jgi:hypothetical protein
MKRSALAVAMAAIVMALTAAGTAWAQYLPILPDDGPFAYGYGDDLMQAMRAMEQTMAQINDTYQRLMERVFDPQAWVSKVRCPFCGSSNVMQIVYWRPTDQVWYGSVTGDLILRRGEKTDMDPDWYCRRCGAEWCGMEEPPADDTRGLWERAVREW